MRLEKLRFRGIGPFTDEQTLDLTAIEGPIVAITGSNGSGKSTLSELWPLAMYREAPTRGKLASLATSRTSFVEATAGGYTIRQEVDAVSGKGEALVLRDGTPVLSDTKVSAFDEWAATHLPQPEVFFASQFGAQGSGGLLSMDKGQRKAVVLRALGIEHLEGMAEQCRERKRSVETERSTLLSRISDEQARGGDVDRLTDDVNSFEITKTVASGNLIGAVSDLDHATKTAQSVALERQAYAAAVAARKHTADLLRQAKAELGENSDRIGNNRSLLADADKIRDAVADVGRLQVELDAARAKAAAVPLAAAEAERRIADSELRNAERLAPTAGWENTIEWGGLVAVETAELALVVHRSDLANAEQSRDAIIESIRQARALLDGDTAGRIDDLRDALLDINSGCTAPAAVAAAALTHDDAIIVVQTAAPGRIAALDSDLRNAETRISKARQSVAECESIVATRPAIEANRREYARLGAAQVNANEAIASAKARVSTAAGELYRVRGLKVEADAVVATLVAALTAAQATAKHAERLSQAEARVAELETARAALVSRIDELESSYFGTPEPIPPPDPPDLTHLRHAVEDARARLSEASATLERAKLRLETARESAARLDGLQIQLGFVDNDLADWARLSHDLGRDGIQAVEIDAAGPVITELTNDLLHQAFGPRFTVSFDTTRPSADGKRSIEDFRVSVIDTRNGREAEAKTFSGGERVILSEAIALALTMLACQRSGVERPTIVRDESGAALDAENGERYVAMLRRAAAIVGADKVLFISHDSATWELADSVITVDNGRIQING